MQKNVIRKKRTCEYYLSPLIRSPPDFKFVNILQDPNDPTIGFLLDGMDHLCCLVRKYIAGLTTLMYTNFSHYEGYMILN